MPDPDLPPEELTCSARGCSARATADLRWNNPKIHTPERRKHWLACPEHTGSLSAFLSARGMLREVVPLVAEPAAEDRHGRGADNAPLT